MNNDFERVGQNQRSSTFRTPLAVIGAFAAFSEITITVGMVHAPQTMQVLFAWFTMLYPLVLMILFFIFLWFKPGVLYAPQEYKQESNFMASINGGRQGTPKDNAKLEELAVEVGGLRAYLEALLKKLAPDQSTEIIGSETQRIARESCLVELRGIYLISFITNDLHIPIEHVVLSVKQAENARALPDKLFQLTPDPQKRERIERLLQTFAKAVADFSKAKSIIEKHQL